MKPTIQHNLSVITPKLAREWHPSKNGKLTPNDVSPGSGKKTWWKCPKGDDHVWEARVAARANGIGCPYCSNKRVCKDNCLSTKNPKLAEDWHPSKNGKFTPNDVTPGSMRKVWWQCKKGHEWIASLNSRSKGHGCPYCGGLKISKDNSLATKYPDLVKEWHPTKNGNLAPEDVGTGFAKKVWWKCQKGHEWEAVIYSRRRGTGCPYCSNQKVCVDNCLATVNPKLASEWHPTKNGGLTPEDVTFRASRKNVWWQCRKGHEWQSVIEKRAKGTGCPYCAGQKICRDNCLAARNPMVAKDWHPTKNGKLTPEDVTPGSSKKNVWWQCKKGHEWKATVGDRSKGTGCPFCNSSKSTTELRIFAELKYLFKDAKLRERIYKKEIDIYIPSLEIGIEYDGWYWHKDKLEKDREKSIFLEKKGITLIRIREEPLENACLQDIRHNRKASSLDLVKIVLKVISRCRSFDALIAREIALYDKRERFLNEQYFYELQELLPAPLSENALATLNPPLAKEWHPTKNGRLTPMDVTLMSNKKVWWKCSKGHEWCTTVCGRAVGNGCPFCGGRKISRDNCLAVVTPKLAKEWHPAKNGKLTPEDVISGSGKNVWWLCNKGHEWKAAISNRKNGTGCPYCSGFKACKDNCLATKLPERANEWHPTKNGKLTPEDVTLGSSKTVWWTCSKGHEWKARISRRVEGTGCSICSGRYASKENCLGNVNPALAKEWHPTKNGQLTPADVKPGSSKNKVWWKCGNGHEWQAVVINRTRGAGCPYCAGRKSNWKQLRLL
jgi:very-short-patch-repair endonuclease